MASELRLRGAGGSSTAMEPPLTKGHSEEEQKERVMEELMAMMQKLKAGPKPGLSNEAKKAKDGLAVNPYDMVSIMRLGLAYAEDEQWQQCATVLLRGFKRVKELPEDELRFEFLRMLCQASLQLKKYKQALAVLNDMEEPIPGDITPYNVLKCQVFCHNGQEQKGLKAFHEALEKQEFQTQCAIWAQCLGALKKVGLAEMTKSKVASFAQNDEDKAKLDAVEKLAEMKAAIVEAPAAGSGSNYILLVLAGVFFCMMMYFLYLLEQRSLKSMNMLK